MAAPPTSGSLRPPAWISAACFVGASLSFLCGWALAWTSNFIVGVGSRMIPGLMGAGGTPLLSPARAATVFVLLNAGITGAAVSAIAGEVAAFRWSCAGPLAAAVVFAAAIARRAGRPRRGGPVK